MRPGGAWGKNAVIVAALLGAGFFAAWLRFRPHLVEGARWTDGVTRYRPAMDDRVRLAVWDAPRPVGGEVNTSAWEGRPAVSPDGRWLVFTVGRPGLGADLWIAELAGGRARRARPLAELNTVSDETAPAFGDGALWFASDRAGGAGGLDLWRAPWSDGAAGPAEPAAGLNGPGDESDPAPSAGDVAFARRARGAERADWDLFAGRVGPDGTWTDAPLSALNSPADEREPAFAADGRALFFSSDRPGGAGGTDLYRSVREAGEWLAPEPLQGLNTAGGERGPSPTPDGFALLFALEDAGGGSDLWRARSRELFRVPGRPVGWVDLVVLVSLLLLALLAWLAKRWERIDVLYRCALVSVLLHLALLWWFQGLYPERDEVALREGGSRTFRVQLATLSDAAAAEAAARRERGGELELEAASREPAEPARWSADAARAVDRPARALHAANAPAETPVRAAAEQRPVAAATAEPSLDAPAPSYERRAGAAPALALATPSVDAAGPTAEDALERWSGESEAVAVRPTGRAVSGAAPRIEVPGRSARSWNAPVTRAASPDLRAAAPVELAAHDGEVAALPLGDGPVAAATTRTEAAPERARVGVRRPDRVEPESRRGPATVGPHAEHGGPERGSADVVRGPAPRSETELRSPATSRVRASESEPAELALEARPIDRHRAADPSGPRRADVGGPRRPDRVAAARAPALGGVGEPSDAERARPDEVPGGAAADVALRDTTGPAERASTGDASPPAPDVLAGTRRLVRAAPRAAGPRRWSGSARDARPARPADGALAALEPAGSADDAPRRERLDHTPYRARFGEARRLALQEHGGTVETERAVADGLAYLARRQRPSGHWGRLDDVDAKYGQVAVGKTGLALLAFLGAGHTPDSDTEWSETARRAVDFLLDAQGRTGHFGQTSAYSHGIATYALAECYALTGDARLRPPLERAVQQILRRQDDRGPRDARTGGWSYYYPDDRRYDAWPRVSVTAWQVMALESARLGGLAVPDRAFADARRFLAGSHDRRRGWMRYSHDPDRLGSRVPTLPGSTPAGLFALSLLGEDIAAEPWRELVAFVERRPPRVYGLPSETDFVERGHGNLYLWYYGALALFRVGGDRWERWNEAMKRTLVDAQAEDGSWAPVSIYATQYAGDTDGDRVYSTAMCVLTLEVYYRYFTPLLAVR